MAVALDTLEVSKRLKSAGFDDAQAEGLIGVLRESRDADQSRLATKDELKGEIGRLENAMNLGFAALRADMDLLRRDIEIMPRDITIRLGGMIVVATGILLAAKFFG
jgi:hypothetical protein